MTRTTILFSLFVLTATTGCDSIESAKENAEKAATAAQESREEIANGRLQQRKGATSESRSRSFKDMREEDAFEHKVTGAVKFVVAFEFQVWTGQKYDTHSYKETLIESGFEEFFRSLTGAFGGNTNYIVETEISPASLIRQGEAKSFLAIAAALHKTNDYSDLMEEWRKDHTSMSMLDLLEAALVRIRQFEDGIFPYEEFRAYEKVVYRYEKVVYKLLQARMNALLLIVMSKSTNILLNDTVSWLRLSLSILDPCAPHWLSKYVWPYDTHFADMNEARRRYVLKVFEHIDKAEKIIISRGWKPEIDPIIAEQIDSISIDPITDNIDQMSSLHKEQANEYMQYLQKYGTYPRWGYFDCPNDNY